MSSDPSCESTFQMHVSKGFYHTSTADVWLPRQKCGPIPLALASGRTPSEFEREKEGDTKKEAISSGVTKCVTLCCPTLLIVCNHDVIPFSMD